MYDLHTHSLLSDGALLPSELAMRYMAAGYRAIAITDHADYSNIDFVISSILKFTSNWPVSSSLTVIPGVELTHLPLNQYKPLVRYARLKGAKIVIGHGQSPAEPVIKGTNRAALEAGVDILAHPGLITDNEVLLAKKKGIFLELTARKGHRQTNNHVAAKAIKLGAKLILETDTHSPEDILTPEALKNVGIEAGLTAEQIKYIYQDIRDFLKKKGVR